MDVTFIGLAEFAKQVEQLEQRHNKVLAYSLTNLAFDVRKATQEGLTSWLTLTRNFLPRSVLYKKATPDKLEASVGFADRAKGIMGLLEHGGTRQPKGKVLAVPINVRRTGKGAIPMSQRPKNITRRKDTFVGESKGGTLGVWKKTESTPFDLLYVFKRQTQYRGKKTKFYETAEKVISENAAKRYAENFNRAFL